MKKSKLVLLALGLSLSVSACGKKDGEETTAAATTTAVAASTTAEATTAAPATTAATTTEAPTTEEATTEEATTEAPVKVMSYAEYLAAEVDDPVVIEAYVQAKQSWWDNKATVYTQDEDGAYFLYNLTCSKEDFEKLTEGTKIRVTGFRTEWEGEIEVAQGATFEIIDGKYIAEAKDVTDKLGTDDLITYQNQKVAFKNMKVEAANDEGAAFMYKWDNSGTQGDDLYFKVSVNGTTYTFTVESYLCDKDTDVYKAVEALKVGDVIDMEGFLYWYNGVNPHITAVKAAGSEEPTTEAPTSEEKGEGVMTYDQYIAAEVDDPVVIEAYVQAKQGWWENKATVYTQDKDGAYFLYNMACSEEDYAKLTEGTKIRVTGFRAEWSGEIEVAEGATFEILEGNYVAEPKDVTELLGTDDLIKSQNQKVSFKGMKVEAINDDGAAFLYKWDGSGAQGDDLYFKVSVNDKSYTFTVESYLCGKDTDVYKAVEGLKVGDTVDMEGFLYWYEGVNPHITAVTVK